ncbi:MAG: protein TolQ [Ponticaulis sp.]|nr:protein TolQ [Ponticaulis sp.]
MEAETLQAVTNNSFSLYELFLRADIVVKLVMGLLIVLSIWSWSIIIDKLSRIGGAVSRAKNFEQAFWSGQPIEEMDDRVMTSSKETMARVFSAASREWRDARRVTGMSDYQSRALMDRAERLMNAATDREISRLETGLGILATIGSVSPFVGLFGTVWGIMNAFREIAGTGSTSLAVVAPGIAEALFATALGLVAAIPAVTFYNKFTSQLGHFRDRLDTFTQEFVVRLSRRLTERAGEGV